MSETDAVIEVLEMVKAEHTVSKNLLGRINKIISFLQGDISLGKDKALLEIEEIVSGNDIDPVVRAEMWSVASKLEHI